MVFCSKTQKALQLGLTGAAATYGLYKTGEILYHDKLGTIQKIISVQYMDLGLHPVSVAEKEKAAEAEEAEEANVEANVEAKDEIFGIL